MIKILSVTKSWTIMRTFHQYPAQFRTATFWTLFDEIVSFRNLGLGLMRLTHDFHNSSYFTSCFKLSIDFWPNNLFRQHLHVTDNIKSFPKKTNEMLTINGIIATIRLSYFARESATQTRLLTLKNPILPSGLLRTNDSKIISFSSPWKLSTHVIWICFKLSTVRNFDLSMNICPVYVVNTVIDDGWYPARPKRKSASNSFNLLRVSPSYQ